MPVLAGARLPDDCSSGWTPAHVERWDGEAWQPSGLATGQLLCLAVHGDDLVAFLETLSAPVTVPPPAWPAGC